MFLGGEEDERAMDAMRDCETFLNELEQDHDGVFEVVVRKRPLSLSAPSTDGDPAENRASRAPTQDANGNLEYMTLKFKVDVVGRMDLKAKYKLQVDAGRPTAHAPQYPPVPRSLPIPTLPRNPPTTPTTHQGASGFGANVAGGGEIPTSQMLNSITEVIFEWEPVEDFDATKEFERRWKVVDGVECAVVQRLSFAQVLQQWRDSETFADSETADGKKPTEDERRAYGAARNHAFYRREGKGGVRPDRLACQSYCGKCQV